jgi:hypothetical protein
MQSTSQTRPDIRGEADCPFCRAVLPVRADKRGGRYFRCGVCLIAFFCSGREVIEQLDTGGTFAFGVRPGRPAVKPVSTRKEESHSSE